MPLRWTWATTALCTLVVAGCGGDDEPTPPGTTSGSNNFSAATSQGDGDAGQYSESASSGGQSGSRSGGNANAGPSGRGNARPSRSGGSQDGQRRPEPGPSRPATPRRGVSGDAAPPPAIPDSLASDMQDSRFAEFRGKCRDLFALRDEMQPLERALSLGSATEAQVERFRELDAACRGERNMLNEYSWQDRFSPDDRRVMAMIMNLPR